MRVLKDTSFLYHLLSQQSVTGKWYFLHSKQIVKHGDQGLLCVGLLSVRPSLVLIQAVTLSTWDESNFSKQRMPCGPNVKTHKMMNANFHEHTTVACSWVRHVQYHGLRALPQHQQSDVTQGRFLFTDVSLIQEAPVWSSIWSPQDTLFAGPVVGLWSVTCASSESE